jgi:hypothetical protein
MDNLPNYGIISTKLDDEYMKYLWNSIEEGKKDNINMNKTLAGNISTSLAIKDKDNKILSYTCSLIQEYEKHFNWHSLSKMATSWTSDSEIYRFSLSSFWVNFQKQNEFNPIHNHSGVYSFVIWMKIPTEWEEQKELPMAKNSGASGAISNFSLIYTNTLGIIQNFSIKMGKDKEGELLLFPSQMNHLVNPFYNCDEERITISGNLYFKRMAKSK